MTPADPRPEEPAAPPVIDPGRVVAAFRYSMAGLASAWRNEGSFRLEVVAALILIPLACALPVSPLERALLIGTVLLVLVVELLNSSIESAIDRISLERHPLSKRAKDTGSAAVLLVVLIPLLTWGAIAGPLMLDAIRR